MSTQHRALVSRSSPSILYFLRGLGLDRSAVRRLLQSLRRVKEQHRLGEDDELGGAIRDFSREFQGLDPKIREALFAHALNNALPDVRHPSKWAGWLVIIGHALPLSSSEGEKVYEVQPEDPFLVKALDAVINRAPRAVSKAQRTVFRAAGLVLQRSAGLARSLTAPSRPKQIRNNSAPAGANTTEDLGRH